jgi:hypothetical protein
MNAVTWSWAWVFDWIVRFTFLGAVAYAVFIIHSERARATRLVDLTLCRRLAELLPLPHLGDRGTLMAMLRDFAPRHDLAVYTAGEPALLVARRHPLEPPGPEEARWIEVHRAALQAGQVVREEECGVLVPLRLRDGTLTGAIIVGTHKELTFDDTARATLRHIAALVGCLPTLVVSPSSLRM